MTEMIEGFFWVSRFFWVGKFDKYFFLWLDLGRDVLGIRKAIERFVVVLRG